MDHSPAPYHVVVTRPWVELPVYQSFVAAFGPGEAVLQVIRDFLSVYGEIPAREVHITVERKAP